MHLIFLQTLYDMSGDKSVHTTLKLFKINLAIAFLIPPPHTLQDGTLHNRAIYRAIPALPLEMQYE